VKHKLRGLLIVGQLVNDCKIIRSHILELAYSGTVRLRVLGLRLALVKHATDFSIAIYGVLPLVFVIMGDPASVYQNGAGVTIPTDMSVERSYDLDALFAAVHLFNLNLLVVLEHALDSDGLHRPFLLEGGLVLGGGPNKAFAIFWRNVDGLLTKVSRASCNLVLLVRSVATLIFCCLLNEH
jgi:hypothetical protein